MWGIRVIRVGVLLAGLLATIGGSGCCECCHNLWGTKSAPPAKSEPQPDDPETILNDWKRGAQSYPGYPNEPKGHLTPEKIHGGIY
jgi:hypothetical protein